VVNEKSVSPCRATIAALAVVAAPAAQHVVGQEVGHTLGLDHQDESGISLDTCMDYYHNTSASDTKSTHPNRHDYSELSTIYQHLDLDDHDRDVDGFAARPDGVARRVDVRHTACERRHADHVRPLGDADPRKPLNQLTFHEDPLRRALAAWPSYVATASITRSGMSKFA
jgi:hypothetical protein